MVRFFLEHGVDVSAKDSKGSTALHLAMGEGRIELACLLVEYGADVEAVDVRGKTPLQVASGRQRDEIALLSEYHLRYLKSRSM